MRSTVFATLLLAASVIHASDTTLSIDITGLTPDGNLIAWQEKGSSAAGKSERLVIAKTLDLSPTDIFTVADPHTATVNSDGTRMRRAARQKIKSLGIKSGRGTQEINDIYGNYRQLAYTARLYLKVSPTRQGYNLEVYDEMSGKSRIIASNKIPVEDPAVSGQFRIKQARLSRDRSTCAVVVEESYRLEGDHTVDKLYTFRVFAAPPLPMPPPDGPPPHSGPPPD
jgi:hypothetical protein